MSAPLADRNAIITGASHGLGRAIAQAFVAAGAGVLICARDRAGLADATSELRAAAKHGNRVESLCADVSNQEDVARLAAAAFSAFPAVHVLVNNAGIYGPKGRVEEVDWEAWVRTIEINLLGSILTIRAFLPHFRGNRYGKIIQLSGGGATAPLPYLSAYAASKAGIVRFIETLAAEVADEGIDANAIAPGALNTRLLDEVLEAGPEKVGRAFYDQAVQQKAGGGAPLEAGAELAVFLASSASDGISGRLISAIWDPWRDFADHREELSGTDLFTLRRIVPKDRGLDWSEK